MKKYCRRRRAVNRRTNRGNRAKIKDHETDIRKAQSSRQEIEQKQNQKGVKQKPNSPMKGTRSTENKTTTQTESHRADQWTTKA
ncbi:hypothetical protein QL285_067133 [Trifolium repens]|nr:hypothetical protein QL285_067133 [Trifolium repens]